MWNVTRREFILTAAVATTAFGVDGRLAISAPDRQAQTPDPVPGFHRYRVGAAECTVLYDGIWEKAHDASFIKNASVNETKQALAVAKLTTSFVPIPISAFVINING